MFSTFSFLRRRPYLLIGCALTATFIVVLAGMIIQRRWELARELQRIRNAGEPVTSVDLSAMYRVPERSPDATSVWRIPLAAIEGRALGRSHGIPLLNEGQLPPPPGDAWPERKNAADFLATHASLMQQIDAAVKTPGECCYLDDFEGGYETLLPHVQCMREVVRLLLLRAYVNAHVGDGDKALADVSAAIQAAETLKREPFMVTQLVRFLRIQECLEALEVLLPRAKANDAALVKLQSMLSELDFHGEIRLAILGERVSALTAFSDPATAGAGKTPGPLYQAFVGDDQVEYLSVMRQLLEAVSGDWPVPLEQTKQYDASGSFDAMNKKAPWGGGTWAAPSGVVVPLRDLVEVAARETARVRAAIVGVAAVRFRNAEGRWPGSMAELIPEYLEAAPSDPFTGGLIILSNSGDGLRIYSVGIDGRDDGGVETPVAENGKASRRGTPDVLFFLRD